MKLKLRFRWKDVFTNTNQHLCQAQKFLAISTGSSIDRSIDIFSNLLQAIDSGKGILDHLESAKTLTREKLWMRWLAKRSKAKATKNVNLTSNDIPKNIFSKIIEASKRSVSTH